MYTQIDPSMLEINPFTTIGKDWFLITAGDEEKFNTMTAAWGFMGYIWNRPVAVVVIRDSRYTREFVENSEHFTLSFFPEEEREKLVFCGRNSGRDCDKIEKTGLVPMTVDDEGKIISFEQANMIFSCTKCARFELPMESFIDEKIKEFYKDGDMHTAYVGYIDDVYIKGEEEHHHHHDHE